MRFGFNMSTNHLLEQEYPKFIKRNFPNGLSDKFSVGAGVVVEMAAHADLCIENAFEDGEWLVCGNPIWQNKGRDRYLCDSCCKRKGIYHEKEEITEKGSFADLVRKMKNQNAKG